MATPKRTLVVQNLKTTLEGITVAGGYNLTVAEVEISPEIADVTQHQPARRPYIAIVEQNERPVEFPGHTRSEVDIDLIGYVNASSSSNATFEANKLRNDIRKAVFVDVRRGDNPDVAGDKNAINTRLRAIDAAHDGNQKHGIIVVGLTIVIIEGFTE